MGRGGWVDRGLALDCREASGYGVADPPRRRTTRVRSRRRLRLDERETRIRFLITHISSTARTFLKQHRDPVTRKRLREAFEIISTTRACLKAISSDNSSGVNQSRSLISLGIGGALVTAERRTLEGKPPRDQRQFPRPAQSPEAGLGSLCRPPVGEAPGREQRHRAATRRVTRSSTSVVLGHAPVQVGGDARIERVIGAAQDVKEPGMRPHTRTRASKRPQGSPWGLYFARYQRYHEDGVGLGSFIPR